MSSYDDGFEKVRETGVIGNSASTSSVYGASGIATNAVFGVNNESFGVGADGVEVTGVVFAVASIGCGTSVGATFTVCGVDVYAVGVGAGGDDFSGVAGTWRLIQGTAFGTVWFRVICPPVVFVVCISHLKYTSRR